MFNIKKCLTKNASALYINAIDSHEGISYWLTSISEQGVRETIGYNPKACPANLLNTPGLSPPNSFEIFSPESNIPSPNLCSIPPPSVPNQVPQFGHFCIIFYSSILEFGYCYYPSNIVFPYQYSNLFWPYSHEWLLMS